MPGTHPERFRISDFGFRICRPAHETRALRMANPSGLSCGAAVPAAHAGGTPALQGGRPGCQVPGCARHPNRQQHRRHIFNQPRMPLSTPTSRKVAVGEAQRGFPRAGRRGVGAGKMEVDGVRPLECSPPARQRRVHRRCLASRHDVVLNVMSACLASSRGDASPEHGNGGGHGDG